MKPSIGIIRRCLEEASSSTYRFKIGAVIFKSDRILASACNDIRSCDALPLKYHEWHNSLHAEQAAITKIKNKDLLKGASILVIKISKTLGLLSNAKPCKACMQSLLHFQFKAIYYSNENGEIVRL